MDKHSVAAPRRIIVAIDGHSSCGKSTMAKALARTVGYTYVDTGAMYRAVALFALRRGLIRNGQVDEAGLRAALPEAQISFRRTSADSLPQVCLGDEVVEGEIRGMAVSAQVSRVAALPFVREAMVEQQRALGRQKGIVMDGRDIGTHVFPQAELKVFVTASAAVRARRRYEELTAKGQDVSYDEILRNVEERDYLDTHRAANPLRRAPDALLLDNSEMDIAEENAWLLAAFKRAAGAQTAEPGDAAQ